MYFSHAQKGHGRFGNDAHIWPIAYNPIDYTTNNELSHNKLALHPFLQVINPKRAQVTRLIYLLRVVHCLFIVIRDMYQTRIYIVHSVADTIQFTVRRVKTVPQYI